MGIQQLVVGTGAARLQACGPPAGNTVARIYRGTMGLSLATMACP
jgi:hypothetical protein